MNTRCTTDQVGMFNIATPDLTAHEIEVLRHAAMRARDKAIADGAIKIVSGIGRGLAFLGRAVLSWPERRSTYDGLRDMSDRELADIGLTRSEISRVFDPSFRVPDPMPAGLAHAVAPAVILAGPSVATKIHTPANTNSPAQGTAAAA